MKFTKMQAYGNDYVYIDAINQEIDNVSELAKFVSDRHFAIGSDGMVLICSSEVADFRMRMFNPDGTEGEMCGNALRSLSKYVYDHRLTQKTNLTIETLGGIQHVELFIENGQAINIRANIGRPILDTKKIPVITELPEFIEQPVQILDKEFKITAVSWGNPHCVMFVDDVMNLDVEKYGKEIEYKTELFPNKTNVTFAQVITPDYIKIREWERGTGETIGCGTGCCTAVTAAVITGRANRKVQVEQIGGILEVEWQEESGNMFMKGPSHTVFEAEIEASHIITKRGKYMNLDKLLDGLDYELIKGTTDKEVSDVIYNTKNMKENGVFVAIIGTTSDSHDFIGEAIKRGANTIVIEKDIEIQEDVTVIKVKSSRLALAKMSEAYFGNPANELVTIGLTGTKGKTSTTFMIKAILESAGKKVGLIGTTGALIGDKKIPTKNTTPESYELQKLFRQMVDEGCKYVVMEVASQGLKMQRVAGINFDYGVFTNISPDHIGPAEHEDFEEYLQCKSLLFKQCKKGIINKDATRWEDVIKDHTCEIQTYSIEADEADLKASNLQFISDKNFFGVTFDLSGKLNTHIRTGVPGRFSVYNSLVAISICNDLGIDEQSIKKALETVTIRGRMESINVSEKYKIIIDYAHNEISMENLMQTIEEYKHKRVVCIFGGGGNRSKLRRYAMGEIGGKMADLCIITEDNPRFEEIADINEDIKVGLNKSNANYIMIDDRREAIKYAMEHAEEGDLILLIGKGHEDYQEVKGVKYPFNEREIILEIAKELNVPGGTEKFGTI